MKKILVAYFSCTGTTRRVAQGLAAAVGADVYEITPAVPYTRADLDWTDKRSRSTAEMSDAACRPQIAGALPDLSDYDVVFIGFPVWWYVEPRIVDTFLESCDFSGKTIIPFATSGGSGISGAEKSMKSLCPSAKFVRGKLVNAGAGAWAKTVV